LLPRVERSSKTLQLHQVEDLARDLQPGHRGIPEPSLSCREVDPSEIEWVLVPGLAFNERGDRLGRGAGHYDRLLPKLRPDVPRWALILDTQWLDEIPTEPHDQPMDGVADHRQVCTVRR
jgi:5-formyltetrahydrofolate cyclo-ligase